MIRVCRPSQVRARLVNNRFTAKPSSPPGKKVRRGGHDRAAGREGAGSCRQPKQGLSKLYRRERTDGPQSGTELGKEAVVILATDEGEARTACPKQPKRLLQFLAESPLVGCGIQFEPELNHRRDINP